MTLALEGVNLSRRFGARWALSGVNLRLGRGDSLLVCGANGAGKSTLLQVLATLLRPSTGSLQVAGIDALSSPMSARRRVVMLGHRTGHYVELSAAQNLRVSARLAGLSVGEVQLREVLARVGLEKRAGDAVGSFSAGMRRRLAMARVLMLPAELVLLDEPFGQLDQAGMELVEGFIHALANEQRSVVLVTHWVSRVAPLLRYGLRLEEGRAVWTGPAEELA